MKFLSILTMIILISAINGKPLDFGLCSITDPNWPNCVTPTTTAIPTTTTNEQTTIEVTTTQALTTTELITTTTELITTTTDLITTTTQLTTTTDPPTFVKGLASMSDNAKETIIGVAAKFADKKRYPSGKSIVSSYGAL